MKNPIKLLRHVALWEGVSFLLLLFIAMPLKYMFAMPMAVRWTGAIHGALFVAFVILLLQSWLQAKWNFNRVALIFICSLIPFAPFILDKHLQKWEEEAQAPTM